jgi:hypothetical protein
LRWTNLTRTKEGFPQVGAVEGSAKVATVVAIGCGVVSLLVILIPKLKLMLLLLFLFLFLLLLAGEVLSELFFFMKGVTFAQTSLAPTYSNPKNSVRMNGITKKNNFKANTYSKPTPPQRFSESERSHLVARGMMASQIPIFQIRINCSLTKILLFILYYYILLKLQ